MTYGSINNLIIFKMSPSLLKYNLQVKFYAHLSEAFIRRLVLRPLFTDHRFTYGL